MNTILHKLKIFAVILARKGKTIWYILVCDDLTLITWNLYYELLWTVGIKEKERNKGKLFSIICFGKYHPKKFWLGENVKLPLGYPFFPPILLIILDNLGSEP